MSELLVSLVNLVVAAWSLLKAVSGLLLPWIPLAVWLGFWLFAVNWIKLREVLVSKGGLLGVLLIGAVWVLIWGVVAPPVNANVSHFIFGLTVSNFVGKLVYVTALFSLMFLCGSVQLSGCCNRWCEVTLAGPHAHSDHGHGGQGQETHGHSGH